MMKRHSLLIMIAALPALASIACLSVNRTIDRKLHGDNPYAKPVFYSQYLSRTNALDRRIQADLDALRANPHSATTHNDLAGLLVAKGFPKDAEVELERAVYADEDFYPAWYNLGLIRSGRGEFLSARSAFQETVRVKPGHAAALFQLGLLEEARHNDEAAVDYYAKAFVINRALLDMRTNPRIADTKLVGRALLRMYKTDHVRESLQLQPTPQGYTDRPPEQAASKQPAASQIVTPAAPATSPGAQTPPPTPRPPAPPPARPAPPPAAPPRP
jgi:tetratricopeptide (TPR) repeat protein